MHTHKIWKRPVERHKSYGTLSKTTHFFSVLCEAGVAQQCTEAQVGMAQDGLKDVLPHKDRGSHKRAW